MNNFNRLAAVYDLLGTMAFGGTLHASQCTLLDVLPPSGRVLMIGGGTGRFLSEFLARNRRASVIYIDLSAAMLRRAAARLTAADTERVTFRHGSWGQIAADEDFDLVCTHCFLDCFAAPELALVMDRLDTCLAPDGAWLFHDFEVSGRGPLSRAWRRAVVRVLYSFFGLVCGVQPRALPNLAAAFDSRGFVESAATEHLGGLLVNRLYRRA
ncbi:MAG: methyltransferase domain-containing protein [Lentisphaeria bacterium]|jgi:ubiquinone/menaquinone biosynthesis C-methylase UbiE|nr:methyltransferase domain-containing protein [Lentisphaeria bacterium]